MVIFQNKCLKFVLTLGASLSAAGCTIKGGSISGTGDLNPCAIGSVTISECKVESSGVIVSNDFGSSITSWSNISALTSVTANIPNGFYVNQAVNFSDTDLTAANIVNGVSIFGVTGSAVGPYAACVNDAINVGQCSTATNRYVTSTLGANVSAANASLGATIPLGFYDGTKTCTASDTNLLAANIKKGVSIFGITGIYNPTFASNQHRDKTTTQISLESEAETNAGTIYTNANPGYRSVPRISEDDDGNSGGSVTAVDRTGWAAVTCGTSGSIAVRIADCSANATLGANATWDGATQGNAGQGTWKLVTRTGAIASSMGREVWRDERTKLLWSSNVSRATNWCKASGSNNIVGNPAAEDDPSDICDQVANQNIAGLAISACFEDEAVNFTTDGTINTAGKGALGLGASTPNVAWRLPSSLDYKQADINGIRFVMPDMGVAAGIQEWTTTIRTANRGSAQVFAIDGTFSTPNRSITTAGVRCVGR